MAYSFLFLILLHKVKPVFSLLGELAGGNSPIKIDEAMTNGNYVLTGQKLPLGKF